MRKVGAYLPIAILAAAVCLSPPAAAFGLRIGPFHLGLPFYRHHGRHPLYMHANPNDTARPATAPDESVTPALLYPNAALPGIFQTIFFPANAAPWPFSYERIFSTAFAKAPESQDAKLCQPSLDPDATIGRIRQEINPTSDQMQSLQKLGGAMGAAAGFLAKACPSDVPRQPVARLQVMESQIEELAMAVDIIRQPLEEFEQSLNKDQQAKLAAPADTKTAKSDAAQLCGGSANAIDTSIQRIDQTVQPTDTQRTDLAEVKAAFSKAVSDLQAHCPTTIAPTALGRMETIESRLDATWRSVLSIQVSLANFESKLSDEQKSRLDQMTVTAAR